MNTNSCRENEALSDKQQVSSTHRDQQRKSMFSFLRTLTTRHCPHSPATRRVDERRPCSDRSNSPAAGPTEQIWCSGFAAVGPY